MQEIYVSTDVETDGPIPGPYSMLSMASAAYTANKELVSSFSVNLDTLSGASAHPETSAWWETQPEAWAECRKNTKDPAIAMQEYARWLEELPGRPVFVGYPAGFDYMFVQWYLIRFLGRSPLGISALDVRSYAMAALKTTYHGAGKKQMPKEWFDDLPHSHVALDDAIEQGALFCNMLRAVNGAEDPSESQEMVEK